MVASSPMSERLKGLLQRSAARNPRAVSLHAVAACMDRAKHDNAIRALAETADDWDARYDIEGAICWRDPHLTSTVGRRAVR